MRIASAFVLDHCFRFACAVGLALPTCADAATVVLTPAKDNTLFETDAGDVSSGQGLSIFAGRTGVNDNDRLRRGLLAFDLAGVIPAGATIGDVTLTLFLLQGGPNSSNRNVSLHRLSADWGEGTSAGTSGNPDAAADGDATWTHRFYPTSMWTATGGDFDPSESASTRIAGAGAAYLLSGSGLVEDVQSWIGNPNANFGWILIGDESVQNTALRFASREAGVELRPRLTIDYIVPEPCTVGLLTVGALLMLSGHRRPRNGDTRSKRA